MGLLSLALAAFLLGGVISFHRQGKPAGIQVVLGLAAAGLLVLAFTLGLDLS
jgi:hypothetical protein